MNLVMSNEALTDLINGLMSKSVEAQEKAGITDYEAMVVATATTANLVKLLENSPKLSKSDVDTTTRVLAELTAFFVQKMGQPQ